MSISIKKFSGNVTNYVANLIIPKAKELKLIAIYLYTCDIYKKELLYDFQRFTNNSRYGFTDDEVMTIYLFAMHFEQHFKVKTNL